MRASPTKRRTADGGGKGHEGEQAVVIDGGRSAGLTVLAVGAPGERNAIGDAHT